MPPIVTIRVFESCNELARSAAERIAGLAAEAVDRRGRFVVALAGGTTPRHTYERLAAV
ncbi:MAG: 6-phosphogluconolactonase, partial [Acidobacteria bacterium]|nr:6-phosphogluconolactonase [Acidobacteriota bacterium]